MLWGDHGWHLGDHDIWCKHTNYEQATRSPLLFVAPGIEGQPTENSSPVELVDIYPTLLELAGLDAAGELHGASLVPILNGSADRVKDVAVSQYPRSGSKMGYAYRTDRHRLVRWRDQDSKNKDETDGELIALELYDYEADPLERRNLADDPAYADTLAELTAIAEAHRESVGKPAIFGDDGAE